MSEEINRLFSDIHEKYDFMNSALSLGVDRKWREETARKCIMTKKDYRVLDVACGTGELSIAIKSESERNGKNAEIIGIDFNKDMLRIAKEKIKRNKMDIKFQIGDALDMKFRSNSFDVVVSSFAMRDFDDLRKFVRECHRVLAKGGNVVLVDMSKPDGRVMNFLFGIYSRIMLIEGMLVDRNAYSFLVSSIKGFDKKRLVRIMEKEGFKNVTLSSLTSGIAFAATGRKVS